MTLEQIKKDIEECGISQWYDSLGLRSVYREPDGYCIYTSTGNRLSAGRITDEHHGLRLNELAEHIA